jgi:TonB family protein
MKLAIVALSIAWLAVFFGTVARAAENARVGTANARKRESGSAAADTEAQKPGSAVADEAARESGSAAAGGAAQITKVPVLRRFIEAAYPARAEAEGIQALVVLEIDIDEQGRVSDARVVQPAEPSGYGFDQAALEAVRQFEFEPAEIEGEPAAVTIAYKYGFALKAKEPETPTAPPAPTLSFTGRLVERGTRKPIVGVTVTAFRGEGEAAVGFEATSKADGTFELYDLEPGEWRVLCDPQGYYPLRTSETLVIGELLEVTYHLERQSYSPYDVLVEARRVRREVDRRTIQTEEIEKIPGTFGDPLGVVTNLPSVARIALGQGEIIVRGSSPEDTRVNVAGIYIPYLYHFGGIRTALPAGMLEYIDFYPGNYSVYYGRGTGGILDLKLKRLAPERIGGYLDVSILDTAVYLEVPLGDKGAIAIGGRRSYIDVLLNNIIPDDAPVSMTTAPRYYDYQLLATYRPTDEQELCLFGFGSDDRLEMIFKNPADVGDIDLTGIDASERYYRLVLEHRWRLTDSVSNEVKLSAGRDDYDDQFGQAGAIKFEFITLQARETVSWRLSEPLELQMGIDTLAYLVSWDVRSRRPPKEGELPIENFDADGMRTSKSEGEWFVYPAAFAELRWQLGDLQLIPGLRVDYFGDMTDDLAVDPRLVVRYAFNPSLTVKGGAGVFHQTPENDEQDEGFGNPDLDVFWAYQYSAGVELQIRSNITLDATFFYKDIRHRVSASDRIVERGGELVPETYNNGGRGRVYGADLLIRHELAHNFFGWLAYTISRAERLDSGATRWRLFDYDQTHILTVLGTYHLPRNWEIGMRWRLVSGNPVTPIHRGTYDADRDEYVPIFGKNNGDRLPLFHQLDLRVDKRWVFDNWMFSAYFDIQNTYNRQNPEHYDYNFDYSERDEGTGMSFLTIVGMRAEF